MDLPAFLCRAKLADEIPAAAVARVESLLDGGATLVEIVRKREVALPTASLRRIVEAYMRLRAWRRAAEPLRGRLPDELLQAASDAEDLAALERATKALPREKWAAGLDLWRRCFALARRDGAVAVAANPLRGAAREYDEYDRRRETLGDMPAHRWLAFRRGAIDGALRLAFELPTDSMAGQARAVDLPDAALHEIVLDALEPALRRALDGWAEDEAIHAAETTYAGLLASAPFTVTPLLAVAIGRPIGAAVLDGDGEVIAGDTARTVTETILFGDRHGAKGVVLPTRAPDAGVLQDARTRLARGRSIAQVSPAGLHEAREGLALPPQVASAAVLGRRALRPSYEWSRVDPVRLGLCEYQQDIDESRLRAALEETREIARVESGDAVAARPAASLGPSVRSFDALKPGMVVQGVVTSVTQFGAFVSLGIAEEGLVHVSELADHYVSNPAEVVRIGQTVLAKVLSIDAERRRISLTLRREERPRPRADVPRGPGKAAARSQALAALDRLFKK